MLTMRILLASRTRFALKFETPTALARPALCARPRPSTKLLVAQLLITGKPGQWICSNIIIN